MNILYCGDSNIEDGLIISVLSLMKNVKKEPLNIYVLTMTLETETKTYSAVSEKTVSYLRQRLVEKDGRSSIQCIDITELFSRTMPLHNMDTRFTPYCMLRLFADLVPELPEKILYLDNDVICRLDCSEFYEQDIEHTEMKGVLDYYGRWFFHNRKLRMNYINSGVLLLNLEEIRRTGLFKKCRTMCMEKKMFMPDQSALNKLSTEKELCDRKYNEQRKLKRNTVFQHFTTSFRAFPWLHTVSVKPWQVEKVHSQLKLREYDDILEEYQQVKEELGGMAS